MGRKYFSAEANFNKNLRNARELNGKAFDESSVRELDALMGVDSLPNTGPSTARGLQARNNLQEGLVDDYSYGRDYANSRSLGAERLSSYRGGSMTDIRARLDGLRGPNGESTPAYEAMLKEIGAEGGRTRPIPQSGKPAVPPASPRPLPSAPAPLPAKAEEAAAKPPSQMTRAERQAYNDAKAQEAVHNVPPLTDKMMQDAHGGSETLLPRGPEEVGEAARGELSKNLSQGQIDELFKPGVNLTREQVLQKTDLILSGRAPKGYRPPPVTKSDALEGDAAQDMMDTKH